MTWDERMDLGMAALKGGDFAAASREFSAALQAAEEFGEADARMEISLKAVARAAEERQAFGEVEKALLRLLDIQKGALAEAQAQLIETSRRLGMACRIQENSEQSERHYRRAVRHARQVLPADHPDLARLLNSHAAALGRLGKPVEAEREYLLAIQIGEAAWGKEHPDLADGLRGLAGAYAQQSRWKDAMDAYVRCMAIEEKALGPEHPDICHSLNNFSGVLWALGKREEAIAVIRRALAIREKALGPDNPLTRISRDNLAQFLAAPKK